jgi:hypothetical protein
MLLRLSELSMVVSSVFIMDIAKQKGMKKIIQGVHILQQHGFKLDVS